MEYQPLKASLTFSHNKVWIPSCCMCSPKPTSPTKSSWRNIMVAPDDQQKTKHFTHVSSLLSLFVFCCRLLVLCCIKMKKKELRRARKTQKRRRTKSKKRTNVYEEEKERQ